eukprot:6176_1
MASPLPKINTHSINWKRSHSFSVSSTYNERYSPSITHYTPEITLPMQHLPPPRESIHIHIRKRSCSLSNNDSYSHTQSHKKTMIKKNDNDMNVVHVLKF